MYVFIFVESCYSLVYVYIVLERFISTRRECLFRIGIISLFGVFTFTSCNADFAPACFVDVFWNSTFQRSFATFNASCEGIGVLNPLEHSTATYFFATWNARLDWVEFLIPVKCIALPSFFKTWNTGLDEVGVIVLW